jgi:type IX secretion system PorP/SprF family membrane protein
MKKLLLSLTIGWLLGGTTDAQDVHFSQYDFSPLHQSAAQTGNFNGDYRFTAIHRVQYRSVTVPYKSIGASFDMKINANDEKRSWWSTGLVFENDVTGDARYKTTNVEFSLAWNGFIDTYRKHQLVLALQPGWMQNGLNFSELYFGSQYDGDNFNPNLPSGEYLNRSGSSNFNINAGLGYHYHFSETSQLQLTLGWNHINQPSITFLNDSAKLLSRYTGVGSINVKLSDRLVIVPQVLWYRQGKFNQFNGGACLQLITPEYEARSYSIQAGLFYRSKDALIARLGAGTGNFNAGFAYDFNISDLKRASNGRGAYEIALSYIIIKVKPLKINPPCPVY